MKNGKQNTLTSYIKELIKKNKKTFNNFIKKNKDKVAVDISNVMKDYLGFSQENDIEDARFLFKSIAESKMVDVQNLMLSTIKAEFIKKLDSNNHEALEKILNVIANKRNFNFTNQEIKDLFNYSVDKNKPESVKFFIEQFEEELGDEFINNAYKQAAKANKTEMMEVMESRVGKVELMEPEALKRAYDELNKESSLDQDFIENKKLHRQNSDNLSISTDVTDVSVNLEKNPSIKKWKSLSNFTSDLELEGNLIENNDTIFDINEELPKLQSRKKSSSKDSNIDNNELFIDSVKNNANETIKKLITNIASTTQAEALKLAIDNQNQEIAEIILNHNKVDFNEFSKNYHSILQKEKSELIKGAIKNQLTNLYHKFLINEIENNKLINFDNKNNKAENELSNFNNYLEGLGSKFSNLGNYDYMKSEVIKETDNYKKALTNIVSNKENIADDTEVIFDTVSKLLYSNKLSPKHRKSSFKKEQDEVNAKDIIKTFCNNDKYSKTREELIKISLHHDRGLRNINKVTSCMLGLNNNNTAGEILSNAIQLKKDFKYINQLVHKIQDKDKIIDAIKSSMKPIIASGNQESFIMWCDALKQSADEQLIAEESAKKISARALLDIIHKDHEQISLENKRQMYQLVINSFFSGKENNELESELKDCIEVVNSKDPDNEKNAAQFVNEIMIVSQMREIGEEEYVDILKKKKEQFSKLLNNEESLEDIKLTELMIRDVKKDSSEKNINHIFGGGNSEYWNIEDVRDLLQEFVLSNNVEAAGTLLTQIDKKYNKITDDLFKDNYKNLTRDLILDTITSSKLSSSSKKELIESSLGIIEKNISSDKNKLTNLLDDILAPLSSGERKNMIFEIIDLFDKENLNQKMIESPIEEKQKKYSNSDEKKSDELDEEVRKKIESYKKNKADIRLRYEEEIKRKEHNNKAILVELKKEEEEKLAKFQKSAEDKYYEKPEPDYDNLEKKISFSNKIKEIINYIFEKLSKIFKKSTKRLEYRPLIQVLNKKEDNKLNLISHVQEKNIISDNPEHEKFKKSIIGISSTTKKNTKTPIISKNDKKKFEMDKS